MGVIICGKKKKTQQGDKKSLKKAKKRVSVLINSVGHKYKHVHACTLYLVLRMLPVCCRSAYDIDSAARHSASPQGKVCHCTAQHSANELAELS